MGYDGTLKFDTSVDSSGFQAGIDKIGKFASGALKATGAIIGGVSTAVAGIGTAAVKTGADFESSMSNVAAISQASAKDMEALTEKAKEMGAKTKFSAKESADAFSYMAMAGWKTGDMLNGIEGIMNLAAASGEDLATTSDIVTDALTAFGLKASDASHFADILAQASSNSNTNVGMMGETFKYVAPVAGALGFSAEDCATAIGLMANSGIKASQAGTSLRSIITRMAKPTDDVQKAMSQLGISLTKSDGSMKSLNEIMLDLRKGFSGLTADQKAQMAATLGGQEAMSGLLAIVNSSDDDFNKLSSSINSCDGAAEKMAETMNDNLSGQITILKSGLEGLAISLYEEMETPLMGVVKQAQEMVQELQDAFNDGGLDAVVSKFGEVMAEIVQKAAEATPELIEVAKNIISSFIGSILNNKEEIANAGATLVSDLVEALFSVSGEMLSAGIELLAQFLQGMVAHAPELGKSFAEMLSSIGNSVQENMPLIIQAAKDFVAGFSQGLQQEFPGVGALIGGFLQGFIGTAGDIIEGIVDVLSDIFGVIDSQDPATMEAVGEAIGKIVAAIIALKVAKEVTSSVSGLFSILKTFKGGADGIVTTISKVVEGFALWKGGAGTIGEVIELQFPKLAAFGAKISGLAGTVSSVVSKIGGFISSAATTVGEFFSTFGSTIAGVGSIIAGAILAVTNFVDMFRNGFSIIKDILMGVGIALAAVGAVLIGAPAAVAAAVAGIVYAVANLVILIKEHFDEIVAFLQSLPEKIGEFINSVVTWFEQLPQKAGEAVNAVRTWFEQLPGQIYNFLTQIISNIAEWGANMLQTASQGASNVITTVVTFFNQLPDEIGHALGYVIGKMIEFGLNAINWVTTEVPKIIENIVTFFSELPGKVWTWLCNTITNIVNWGIDMYQKASQYASNAIDAVVNFFATLPGKVWTWLTDTISKIVAWGSSMVSNAKTAASNTISSVVNFFATLPGKVWTWLGNTVNKVASWGANLRSKGAEAAGNLVGAVVSGVSSLPSRMLEVGKNIVHGVWNGICNAAGWFKKQVKRFFSGIVDGVKDALGIHSPSRVFADEVGKWIPPGIGEGVSDQMPKLEKQTESEMQELAKKMQTAVNVETGKITLDKNVEQTYKVDQENGQSFDDRKTEVVIEGETHVHVDLDGKEIAEVTTPYIDENLGKRYDLEERGV